MSDHPESGRDHHDGDHYESDHYESNHYENDLSNTDRALSAIKERWLCVKLRKF